MASSPRSVTNAAQSRHSADDVTWNVHSVTLLARDQEGEDYETEDLELETEFAISDYHERLIARLDDGGWLVGYLNADEDCQNPLESCDGMGEIFQSHRARGSDESIIWKEIGMDEYGNPDLEDTYSFDTGRSPMTRAAERLFPAKAKLDEPNYSSGELDRIIKLAHGLWIEARANGQVGNPHAVALSFSCHGAPCRYWVAPDDEQFLNETPEALWIPTGEMAKDIVEEATKRAKKAGALQVVHTERRHLRGGAIHAVHILSNGSIVTRRERSGVEPAALSILAHSFAALLRAKELEVAREWAANACTEYTAWCNGDCWGRCIERFGADGVRQPDDDDHVWGLIGDYAEQVLREEFAVQRAYYDKKYAETRTEPELACT